MGAGRGWGVWVAVGLLFGCGGRHEPVEQPPVTVAAQAPELHFEGRFDDSAPAGPRFEWPGSAVWLRFTGTGASVVLGEHSLESDEYGQVAHNGYDLWVDGARAG